MKELLESLLANPDWALTIRKDQHRDGYLLALLIDHKHALMAARAVPLDPSGLDTGYRLRSLAEDLANKIAMLGL